MNFVSAEFILFFPFVLLLYWVLPYRFRWILLLIASYFFYLYWAPWTLLLLISTTIITYIAARIITVTRNKKLKSFWLAISLIVCLGCLIAFKYLGFITENLNNLLQFFGAPSGMFSLKVFLPVGISFYTFQTLSYVIDVYRGDIETETHPGYYALFISYFPQLVAGPIERPSNLLPQLRSKHVVSAEDLMAGLMLILRGFFKKLVIADYLAHFVDLVYRSPEQAGGAAVMISSIFFAFQIYCDFSGYSDIAAGAARMMGIRLMVNFNEPYSATGIQDFWRRWHISLTSWFTDYLYKPLGGSRKGLLRRCINIMIVFIVSGAWHGASWTFILWGGIHGILMLIEILWRKLCGYAGKQPEGYRRAASQLITFLLVCFTWIFFRAATISDAFLLVRRLFTEWSFDGWMSSISLMKLGMTDIVRIILMFVCMKLLRRMPEGAVLENGKIHTLQEGAVTALAFFMMVSIVTIAWLALLSINANSTFLYFQF